LDIVGALDTVILHLTSHFCLINPSDEKLEYALNCHGAGNLREAEAAYREILAAQADNIDALHYLGVVCLQTGRFEEAVRNIESSVKLQPDNVDAVINFGNALQAAGRLGKAIESFELALKLSPNSPVLLANLGNAYRQQGDNRKAIALFEESLNADPTLAEVRRNLADTLLDEGLAVDALKQILDAEKTDGQSIPVKASLANILHANFRYDEAIAAYETVLATQVDFPPVLCNLAVVYANAGRTSEAKTLLEKVTRLDPTYVEGHYSLGIALQQSGNKDAAARAFRQAVALDPGCGKAWRSLAALETCNEDSELRGDIVKALSLTDLVAKQRLHLEFAAGKCFEDQGEYDKAMQHLREGNRLQRETFDYDVNDDVAVFENIKQTFNESFFPQREKVGASDATAIFIVGMPRSGTSLIEQILSTHADVFGGGELPYFAQAINSRVPLSGGVDCTASISSASDEDFVEIAERYLMQLRKLDGSARFVTDKLPNNFLHIGLIKTVLPNARIIHCVRDARDTCWSIYKNYFAGRGHTYAYEQSELGRYYSAYEDLMAHWKTVLPDVVYDVSYADLIANQEQSTRALLDACGLEWDSACLEFHRSTRAVRTLSAAQVREPIHDRSMGAWRNVEKSLGPLLAELGLPGDT
jgi:tetratricopeptide (TPR) repeat protein